MSTGSGSWRGQVTNAQFAEFVDATGYLTVAERPLNPADYPDAPAENLQPGSMVFTRTSRTRGPSAPQPVVDVDARGVVAPSRRSAVVDRQARRPPGRARRLRGRRSLRGVGRYVPADRGRMGDRGPRRTRPSATTPGATSRNRPANGWPTTGTATSRGGPRRATDAPLRSAATRPTATACSTWPATCGSGPPTGTAKPATTNPVAPQTVTTRGSRSSRCPARWSRAARSCAPTSTACGTGPPRAGRSRSTPA